MSIVDRCTIPMIYLPRYVPRCIFLARLAMRVGHFKQWQEVWLATRYLYGGLRVEYGIPLHDTKVVGSEGGVKQNNKRGMGPEICVS